MMRKVMKEKKGMKKKPIAKNLDQGEDNILALTLYLRYKIEGGDEKKPPLMSKLASEEKREEIARVYLWLSEFHSILRHKDSNLGVKRFIQEKIPEDQQELAKKYLPVFYLLQEISNVTHW